VTRPTRDQLAHAQGLLEELAHQREPGLFHDVAWLMDLLVWLNQELDAAKQAAAYGPGGPESPEGGGTIGGHTIGRHGLGRPVEERLDFGNDDEDHTRRPRYLSPRQVQLNDPLVRELRKLRAGWATELAQLVDSWKRRSKEAANWPKRTEQTG
jgi:hypothetical protein